MVGDWKTWNKEKYPAAMVTYFLQVVAYMGAINRYDRKFWNLGLGINHAAIFGVTEDKLKVRVIGPQDVLYFWREWLRIVAAHYYELEYDWDAFKKEAKHHTGEWVKIPSVQAAVAAA